MIENHISDDFQDVKGEILANAAVFGNQQAVDTPDKIVSQILSQLHFDHDLLEVR